MTHPVDRPAAPAWRRWLGWWANLVIGLLVLAMIALPIAAEVASGRLESPPLQAAAALPALVRHDVAAVRDLPVLTPNGPAAAEVRAGHVLTDPDLMRNAIDAAARRAFGGADTTAFWQVLTDEEDNDGFYGQGSLSADDPAVAYPYRFPSLDAVLDQVLPRPVPAARAADVNDLAALLILAAADFPEFTSTGFSDAFPAASRAASTAFDLLDRDRQANPSCAVQLNLAFLLSTDNEPQDDLIATEFNRAHDRCPADPTPLWLLGQFQLERAYLVRPDVMVGQNLSRDALAPRASATFHRLQQELPASPAGWSGAADAEVKLAEEADQHHVQPFTARHRYEHALTLYQRAAALSTDPGIEIGIARALTGQGRYDDAAAAARRAHGADPRAGAFQTQLTLDLERAGHWSAAADQAAGEPLADRPAVRSLISAAGSFGTSPTISAGIQRLTAVTLTVAPPPGRGAAASVYDYSFIPAYRDGDEAFTGYLPWCRQQSRLRDLILAGRYGDVLRAASAGVKVEEFNPGYACLGAGAEPTDPENRQQYDDVLYRFAAVAAAESGDAAGAAGWLRKVRAPFGPADAAPSGSTYDAGGEIVDAAAYLADTRQNLWRFAGNLPRAAEVTRQWTQASPADPVAWDRAGEIAFEQGQFADAAQAFARSGAAITGRTRVDDISRATAQLKRGASLGLAGQHDQAVTTLRQAQAAGTASAAAIGTDNWADEGSDNPGAYHGALIALYSAAQLGDAGLRQRDYAAAADGYRQAVTLSQPFDVPPLDAPAEHQPNSVLSGAAENNLALAQLESGHAGEAIAAATAAVGRDPQSPVYLQTQAYAQVLAGQPDAAATTYQEALAGDPTLFPADNDLGVLLAHQGHSDAALARLEDAVGAKPDYALGWFNLGVLLSGMGPSRFLEAQGALGRAAQLDSSYRSTARELSYDAEPYFSGLDISRPLPPQWRFAQHERSAPAALTLIVVLLLLGRLVWSLGLDQVSGKVGERMLGWAGRDSQRRPRWLRVLGARIAPVVAVLATLALLLWPLLRAQRPQLAESGALAAGILALTLAYMRVRVIVARRAKEPVRHFTWLPSVAFGAVITGIGLAFAPVPAADTTVRRGLLRWAPLAALAALAVSLLLLGWLSGVPITRALGASALVMVSSVLLPSRPYDGAFISGPIARTFIPLALLALTIPLLLNWI